MIGYCATERPSDCVFRWAANAKGSGRPRVSKWDEGRGASWASLGLKTSELGAPGSAFVYAPYAQAPSPALMLAVRSKAAVADDVRRMLADLRPDVALFQTVTMARRLVKSLEIVVVYRRVAAWIRTPWLLLATPGLYGVLVAGLGLGTGVLLSAGAGRWM